MTAVGESPARCNELGCHRSQVKGLTKPATELTLSQWAEAMALIVRFGTTTTDAAMLSPALGTLRAQTFLEIEADGIVASTLKHVFDFSWAVEKISELPSLGFVVGLLAPFSTAFCTSAALAA